MSYFPDFSKYKYTDKGDKGECMTILNIGWIDKEHDFKKGVVHESLINNILKKCTRPINRTRGYHICPFCDQPSFGVRVELDNGDSLILGSAEIRVKGKNQVEYACPDLIYHYIVAHQYMPPKEFLDALRD